MCSKVNESGAYLRVQIVSVRQLLIVWAHVLELPGGITGEVGDITQVVLGREQTDESIMLCATTQTAKSWVEITKDFRALRDFSATYRET